MKNNIFFVLFWNGTKEKFQMELGGYFGHAYFKLSNYISPYYM